MTDDTVKLYYFNIKANTTPASKHYQTESGANFHIMITAHNEAEGQALAFERIIDHAYTDLVIEEKSVMPIPLPPGLNKIGKGIAEEAMTSGMGVAIFANPRPGHSVEQDTVSKLTPVNTNETKH